MSDEKPPDSDKPESMKGTAVGVGPVVLPTFPKDLPAPGEPVAEALSGEERAALLGSLSSSSDSEVVSESMAATKTEVNSAVTLFHPGFEEDETPNTGQTGSNRTIGWIQRLKGGRLRGGLGTFQGVFRPTILTILGVMMYLRLGWVVGEAGLLGALAVLIACYLITATTALSLSSITTNIRLGAGGAFSIIAQSLGLETGGAIGVPLYLAQAMSVALYVYGFAEGWSFIFPDHPQWAIALAVAGVVFAITSFSTQLAFRLQGIVMLFIVVSLTTILLGAAGVGQAANVELHHVQVWSFKHTGFWEIFAVFFPAATGIMVGASMSGELRKPRKSVPLGTLAAVVTSFIIYAALALWYSLVATPEELRTNFLLSVERSAFAPIVLGGILASTFTAALSSTVAAPRILQALANHRILPKGEWISAVSAGGEPRRATAITGLIVVGAIMLGSLDRVAVLITMFFLITYVTINLVVLIEQSLGMVSFRPLFRIPIYIPLIGLISGIVAIFVISPAFALLAFSMVVAIYIYLTNIELETPWETVRSSIFVSLSDWAAKKVATSSDTENERSWKPDVLVPVTKRSQLDGSYRFLRALVHPKGSLQIVGVRTGDEPTGLTVPPPSDWEGDPEVDTRGLRTRSISQKLKSKRAQDLHEIGIIARDFQVVEGIYTSAVVIEAPSLVAGISQSSTVMRGGYFKPNVLFALAAGMPRDELQGLYDIAVRDRMGAALLMLHEDAGLGHERIINVWVRDQSPEWELGLRLANLDLSVLFAFQIGRNWQGRIRLICICSDPASVTDAQEYLEQMSEDARLPNNTEFWVEHGDFLDMMMKAPKADLQILGLPDQIDTKFMTRMVALTESSALFVRDSGRESALA